jgi:hypothetical protein
VFIFQVNNKFNIKGDFSVDTEIRIESLESRPNEDIDITAAILKKKEENLKN